jgi:release factor glutamine methyltransferase
VKPTPLYGELQSQLATAMTSLPDKPEETVENTLHALWHRATGQYFSTARAMKHELPALTSAQELTLRELVQRRISGVPLSHIIERQSFMGLEMLAGPQALVPRAETELLARSAIQLAASMGLQRQPVRIIDVCTGSGNLALAIAHHVPAARVHAADLSEDAISLATRNAQHLGLSNRVELKIGDLLSPFDTPELLGNVDLLTCNPPYISSAKVKQMPHEISAHEPSLAFDGGPFGVSILMRLLGEAPRFLHSGGWLAFEVGLGQGPALTKRLQANTLFDEIHPHKDAHGDIRALTARRA